MSAEEETVRTEVNRVASWTGTVHYADGYGRPACGPVKTHSSWLVPTADTVTCKRCISQYGDERDMWANAKRRIPREVRA
jgi:hypothetical protein